MTDTRWSPAQVAALVSDTSSLRGARSVADAAHWQASGRLDDVLWGLCRGSSSRPYQVCVDLSGPAYRCTCPSRRVPCKHALGLLLFWAGGAPFDAPPEAFAAEWAASRAARAARATSTPKSVPDPEAAAKRAAQRAARVAAGMTELRQWLADQVQHGLAHAAQGGHRPFETMAARLVDAQAPTAASAVRRIGGDAGVGRQWADRMLGDLGMLWMLVTAHERLGSLPAPLAATVRSRIGFPIATDDVLAGPRTRDLWQVLGRVDTDDGNLITRRTWLLGVDSGRFALLLAFAVPGQPLAADVVPGTEFDADLCFYPGALPLRALVAQSYSPARPAVTPVGAVNLRSALAGWSAALAAEPWRFDTPVLLDGVVPGDDGWLVDSAGDALPLATGHRAPWWLLAAAGGNPATLAAEWSPFGLRPLAAWVDGRYVPAAEPVPEPGPAREPELPPELLAAALVGTARRPWTGHSVMVGRRPVDLAFTSRAVAVPLDVIDPAAADVAAPPAEPAASLLEPAPDLPADPGAPLLGAGADLSADPAHSAAPQADPAASLLEAAAVALVYRRAGIVPAKGHRPVTPAPPEIGRPVPAAAGARLLRILGNGTAPVLYAGGELLSQWLAAAARQGGFMPPEALPDLLDAGRRNAAIRPDLGKVAGRRGAWLAGMRTDWAWLLDEAPGNAAEDPAAWDTGTTGERLAYLVKLRAAGPAAGRDLLDRAWPKESGDSRERLLTALETGLSPADDAFLERVLDDRRRGVREAALALLRRLPDSGLARRMAARAEAAVGIEPRPFGRERLVVSPPEELDAALRRDGVDATPARGVGIGAWLLEEIVAGTPLRTWSARFRRTPEEILDLARGHDWETPLLNGWAKAAIAQHDAGWATALVAGGPHTAAAGLRESIRWDLHLLLPPDELARIAADLLRRDDPMANRLLALHTGDWPDQLAVTVVETIARRARTDRHSWQLAELCRTAAPAMPPRFAPHVARLAAELDGTATDPSRVRPVAGLAQTLTFRHEMLQEFE